MSAKKIKLHSGPWNGRSIEDIGTVEIKMCIKNPTTGNTGIAVYIPDESRKNAFWERNEWFGKCIN